MIRGATFFEGFRTIEGITYSIFKEAYIALGLLQDDKEWNQCLAEAKQIQSGAQLHYLFATLLIFCNPARPEILWKNYIQHLATIFFFKFAIIQKR